MARKFWRGPIGAHPGAGQRAAEESGPIRVLGPRVRRERRGCTADSWWCQSWGQRAHGGGQAGGAHAVSEKGGPGPLIPFWAFAI